MEELYLALLLSYSLKALCSRQCMKRIFIDPFYPAYENNKLFDASDTVLNRDDSLAPYIRLKKDFELKSLEVMTYDLAKNFSKDEIKDDGYISFGNLRDKEELKNSGLKLLAFYLMEPPLVTTKFYKELPYLSKNFEKIFIHNITGDCYSLEGVDQTKLYPLYWGQPYGEVVEQYWANTERKSAVIVINGNHKPRRMHDKELYSQRIEWALNLSRHIHVDLFGRGWNKILSRSSLWAPFLKNYFSIQKIYRGPCQAKLPLMATYDYVLCFENLIMDGYITEKIFDCFYSGAIPIYRGGNDITNRIPGSCFIDLRDFKDAKELSEYLLSLTKEQKKNYRLEAKKFILSEEGQKFYKLIDVLKVTNE